MSRGSVRYLEVDGLKDAGKNFRDSIQTFQGYVRGMQSNTSSLLDTWDGKGRNQFETQYKLMEGQLKDIDEVLHDIYDALVDAQTAYIDADETVAKQISVATAD